MAKFNPATVTVTAGPGGSVILAPAVPLAPTTEQYQCDLGLARDVILGRDRRVDFLLFQIGARLDQAGFVFAGKSAAQIKTAIEALTNIVW
jgi:hypothetical protein